MNAKTVLALILIAAGVAGLVHQNFSYTSRTHTGQIGSLEVSVGERKQVHIPVWASVAVLVVGVGVLLTARPK